jgi:hypothetical protein
MRILLPFLLAILGAGTLALWGGAYLHGRAMTRAAMLNARAFLQAAYADYERTGTLREQGDKAHVRIVTNAVVIDGINYQCALAVDWPYFSGEGSLAVTTNRVFLWLDKTKGSKVIDSGYRPPLFSRGL